MLGNYSYPLYYEPRCAEFQDCTMISTPVFEGNRMYFRGMANLYCVEENVWAVQTADVSNGEMPLTVQFDGNKSRGMPGRKLTKYAWDFGDGSTSSPQVAAKIVHTYANAGTYTAKLTVTDDQGASDAVEAKITVTLVAAQPPVIKSVEARGASNLLVRFSKPVEQASAENVENYTLGQGVKILGGALDSDPAAVILTTTPLAEEVKYELAVKNVKDRARKANTIADNSRQSFYRLRSPPDEEGYIRNWLRLPNIPLKADELKDVFSKEFFPGQKTCAPKEGDKVSVGGKELAWKVLRADEAVISLYQMDGMNFGVTYITCNEDLPGVRLRIGGSHDSSLWQLNGQELIRVSPNRGLSRDQCVSELITLKKGRNVLAAQVVFSYGSRGMCARFVDKDGNPVRDYSVSTEAPAAPPPGP